MENLDESEKAQVNRISDEFHDIFFLPCDPPGCAKDFSCEIRTSSDKPVHRKQCRYPLERREEINLRIKKMFVQGII